MDNKKKEDVKTLRELSKKQYSEMFDFDIKKEKKYLIIFAILSIIFVCINSCIVNPIARPMDYDASNVIRTVGYFWTKGSVPYKDLWTSVGPFPLFVNAIAYFFHGGNFLIAVFEIVSIAVTLYFGYKTLRMVCSPKWSFLITIAGIVAMIGAFGGGNVHAEYTMPFMAVAFYLYFRWCIMTEHGFLFHDRICSLIYGIAIGVGIMSKGVASIPVILIVIVVVGTFVSNKMWKPAFKNLGFTILGAMAIILPFVIYFLANGSIKMLFDVCVERNIITALKFDQQVIDYVLLDTPNVLSTMFISFVMLVAGIFVSIFYPGRVAHGFVYVLSGIAMGLAVLLSGSYYSFSVGTIPMFFIAMAEFGRIMRGEYVRGNHKRLSHITCIIIMVLCVVSAIPKSVYVVPGLIGKGQAKQDLIARETIEDKFLSYAKENNINLNDVVTYNFYSDFYINNKIKPRVSNFARQTYELALWRGNLMDLVNALQSFRKEKVKHIVMSNTADTGTFGSYFRDNYIVSHSELVNDTQNMLVLTYVGERKKDDEQEQQEDVILPDIGEEITTAAQEESVATVDLGEE